MTNIGVIKRSKINISKPMKIINLNPLLNHVMRWKRKFLNEEAAQSVENKVDEN